MDKVEKALHTRSDNFTALLEKKRKEVIQEHGSEWLNTLKKSTITRPLRNWYLTQPVPNSIRRLTTGSILKSGRFIWNRTIIGDVRLSIVMRKKFAGYTFSTFTFNLLMLGIFALLVIISIFAEFPGKYLNKGSD